MTAIEVIVIPVHASADFEPAIANFSRHPNSGLIFPPDQFAYAHRGLILELVERYRVPAIYSSSDAFATDPAADQVSTNHQFDSGPGARDRNAYWPAAERR
jgi:hypothetical protein